MPISSDRFEALSADVPTVETGTKAYEVLRFLRHPRAEAFEQGEIAEGARLEGLMPRGTPFVLFTARRGGEITVEEFVELLETLLEEGFSLEAVWHLWQFTDDSDGS